MKPILKALLFTLAVVLLSQCERDEPNPKVKITDNNFLNALIELGIDTDGDGQINHAETEVVISLDVSEDSISDMTGIEKFVNLDTLWCYNNQLTSLDISNNISLGLGAGYYTCFLEIENMPTLEKVCVWTMPFPPEGFLLCKEGSPNVYFTTDCGE